MPESMSVERNGLRKVTKEHGTHVQEGKETILYPSPQEQDEEIWKEVKERLSDSKKPRKNVPKLKVDYTIGEMERDAILAHGTFGLLKESTMERADKFPIYVSRKTGNICVVNPNMEFGNGYRRVQYGQYRPKVGK